MSIRVIFMGSPDFALPTLSKLAELYQVVGVVTQPDRPAGRGRVLTPPPVKTLALDLGLEVIQPEKLRQPGIYEKLVSWQPEMIVVAAFGQILRQNVLDLPVYGCINVHASLLPRWRGAAPIQAAILNGDLKSGVTIMKMDAGVDTGDMLSQVETPLAADETAESLSQRLASLGADLLANTLPGYLNGSVLPVKQDDTLMTKASMLNKEDGLLDFTQPAEQLERRVRAFYSWPGTFFQWDGAVIKVQRAHVKAENKGQPGEHQIFGQLPAVVTSEGWLVLDEVQPAGKKSMPGEVFLRGARNWR
jgi:methionyl-tRNA formyltransferase